MNVNSIKNSRTMTYQPFSYVIGHFNNRLYTSSIIMELSGRNIHLRVCVISWYVVFWLHRLVNMSKESGKLKSFFFFSSTSSLKRFLKKRSCWYHGYSTRYSISVIPFICTIRFTYKTNFKCQIFFICW